MGPIADFVHGHMSFPGTIFWCATFISWNLHASYEGEV